MTEPGMNNEAKLRDYLKRATADLRRANRRLGEVEAEGSEPIAIVGMSCRYPGGVESPAGLWELLEAGGDGISGFPDDRGWDLERLFDPDPDHTGTSYSRAGGFLADPAGFDAEFFGIGPREALAMDPQQRLLLEGCWEALEDAGLDPTALAGSATGVFAGVMYHDYATGGANPAELEGYFASGVAGSVASGRVAYTLGLEGPAVTLDTACSSSLVTLHLAAHALRAKECSLALAGGVTVLATPGAFIEFSRQRGLAPDGRCKSFAAAADGVGWAEGAGMLVLERLSDAEANGHPILAVVRGSAVNQDGASNGLTAPNGPSQQRVIRQALANARLRPEDVDLVEAHGTGTTLGDPIEAGALLATYGRERGGRGPLRLGSVKSNIGHTQAAAGVAGVIKAVLALREGTMPKTLHLDRPSEQVDWAAGEIELLAQARPWEPGEEPRRAAVSSFGISGTNAHVILEEAPVAAAPEAGEGAPAAVAEALPAGLLPLLLSAKSEDALRAQAGRVAARLEADPGLALPDLAYSLATSRTAFEQRVAVLAGEREEALAALRALAAGGPAAGAIAGAGPATGRLAYLFTGQGSQRQGMGRELYAAYPAYAEAFDRVCAAIDPELGESLKALVFSDSAADAERLDDTTHAQPAIFATEVALAELLASFGLEPELLAGHSIGEIAAAHLAGVFSLEDAAKLIVARGRLMGELPAGGAMVALEGTEAEVAEAIAGREGEIAIAALNAPTSTVVSGAEAAVAAIEAAWKAKDRRTKRLAVSHAFHSPLMEPMLAEFARVARSLSYKEPRLELISTVSGEAVAPGELADPAYWVAQVRSAVRFADGLAGLAAAGAGVFVEVGPDAVLSALGPQCLPADSAAAFVPSLRGGEPEPEALVAALAGAHAHGATVDWKAFFAPAAPRRVPLPTYPFQRQRYWLESAAAADASAIGQEAAEHPLLGAAVELADGGLLLTGRVSLASHPWLADHAVAGTVLLPGTALLELALGAAARCGAGQVEELNLEAPLALPESGSVALRVSVGGPGPAGEREIAIHSRGGGEEGEPAEWSRHAVGILGELAAAPGEPLTAWPAAGAEEIDLADLYATLADLGLEYGPAFQGLTRAWRVGAEIQAEVALAPEQADEAARYLLHPALADAALHAGLAAAGEDRSLRLPFAWRGVSPGSARGVAAARVVIAPTGETGEELALRFADAEGTPLATIAALATREVSAAQLRGAGALANDLFAVAWQAHTPSATAGGSAALPQEPVFERSGDAATDALAATEATLVLLQEFLADEEQSDSRLAILTEGAVAVSENETPDPVAAAIWGLVRSAQAEHPGRFLLVDGDGSEASAAVLPSVLEGEEPQLALREGKGFCPRVQRVAPVDPAAGTDGDDESAGETLALDPERTVLLTGATGALGALFAEHLVKEHGAKHLLLVSRSGPTAAGADELQTGLEDLGASVRIEACDVADRDALAALLASVDPVHPLGAVVHAAGVLDDALVESMSAEQVRAVFPVKADAAQALHELTAEAELSAFVLFSSAAGVLGGPGQGNYAAANCFLDALAEQRRFEGLPATSIAWGLWNRESTMTGGMGEADLARMARLGIEPIDDARGTDLFERALAAPAPVALALPLDPARLRALAAAGTLAPLLGSLVRAPGRRRVTAVGALGARLAELAPAEREDVVAELVRGEVAAVLGHEGAAAIDPARAFKDMGFDSLAAVELRNGLAAATGLVLAPTLVFDYPTPEALSRHLLELATAAGGGAGVAVRAQASDEPIAIVGMSCRYPGGVESPAQLWELLAAGRDGIGGFPGDRGWDLDGLFDSDPERAGTSYAREGGFLAAAGEFDAEFFGISPREALAMDPQQRLLLEGCWEALEDAGLDPTALAGTATGVFAGLMYHDYGSGGALPAELEGYFASGAAGSVASGRVAYTLGLEGPAMTVDTACSSSLVTLHLAAQALRGGECSLALAGGATVLATPTVFTEFSRQRGLAPDGRCKPFAEGADGTGWSEGVGMLVLERLSDAERNGHPILAVVRGSAVNQDGASNGLTAPNGPSQQRVIRQALANARLEPKDIDVVEAHGTGTTLGDPIEAGAVLATYGQDRGEKGPLYLGAIKSNLGHTQAAAGVAGVIKAVLAMREQMLPKTLHLDRPSSNVDWSAGEVELLADPVEWKPNGAPRRAGVSSFGISGTNAHVILEEPPASAVAGSASQDAEVLESEGSLALPGQVPLALSAKSEPALRDAASRLVTQMQTDPEVCLTDLAYSLATSRATFGERAVIVGSDREELLAGLESLAAGSKSPNFLQGSARTTQDPVFLFPGQGSQWAGMALGLYESSAPFKEQIDACEQALAPFIDWSLVEVLRDTDGKWMERLEIVQPALFAVMVSLARLWQQCGVTPSAVIGHSQGEIAAAHIAGALSLEDAARIVATRAQAMAKIAGQGGMLSVSLSEQELTPLLEQYEGRVSLAAINGPASLVVSGEPDALKALQATCEEREIRAQLIAVDYAAHSAQVETLKDELLEAFAPVSPQTGEIPLHSTVTGELIDTAAMDAEYWYRNLRETVLFEPVLRSVLKKGARCLIELGPHPVLSFGAQETIDSIEGTEGVALLSTLRREEGGPKRFLASLGQAHANGAKVDWPAFFEGSGAQRVPLPTYPFQRQRYWLEGKPGAGDASAIGLETSDHPLLGATMAAPEGDGFSLSGAISLATHPWLADHAVAGTVLLPGSAFLELALCAASNCDAAQVRELTMQAPLLIPESGSVALRVTVSGPDESGERELAIHSRPTNAAAEDEDPHEWTRHAEGSLATEEISAPESLSTWPPAGAEQLDLADFYASLADLGFEYGPAFQGLTRAWSLGEEIYAEVALAPEQGDEAKGYLLHPALSDSALHPIRLLPGSGDGATLRLPERWRGVSLDLAGAGTARVELSGAGADLSLQLRDGEGRPLMAVASLTVKETSAEQMGAAPLPRDGLLVVEWQEHSLDAAPDANAPETIARQPAFERSGDAAADALAATKVTLSLIQEFLADEENAESRLAILTERAVAVGDDESPDPVTAAIWGLVRSAQSEHPGRFLLVDSDGSEASKEALPTALAGEEQQFALRDGKAFWPRVQRVAATRTDGDDESAGETLDLDSERTVLITGATGGLGVLFATHLVEEHGARHLLLVSRSGPGAAGADELQAQLESLGTSVRIAACDVADRAALSALLASVDPEHPLGAVVHAAGTLEDALIETMTAEQVEAVFPAKADAAQALHELTTDADLSAFVLFSSAAGVLGGPGQGNYAAANSFLDALAQRRRSEGLPATSIAWGLWNRESAMTGGMGRSDLARMERMGVEAIGDERGLGLFDQALAAGQAASLALPLDRSRLRALAAAGLLPPLFGGLVRVPPRRRATAVGSLGAKLAELAPRERAKAVLDLVLAEVAAILGHDSAAAIEPDRAFKDMGFDSLAAVELKNGLALQTGLNLQPTLVFDYPTPVALAEHLLAAATASGAGTGAAVRAQASDEPVAIVGMACRYPGGADSPDGLWQLLAEGRDGIGEFPADRGWDLERLFDPDPDHPGTSYTSRGGFLADLAGFDAEFFGISPREALTMDPQQRLLLESCWEALEDAGVDPDSLAGSDTGVFAGASRADYADLPSIEGLRMVGLSSSIVTGRVAYALGLEGPAVTIDTACSSSLVSLHLAAQALRGGECSLALAGGVTALATPTVFVEFSRQRGLAPDGHCKAFAAGADGTGWSEGVGMLVLERLADAERNGHPVLAVIRGSAVNQDGASNGLTAPNGPSQQRVIRQALANARLEPRDVDAVEAHGTGTTLGDPIEAGALLATYGQDRGERGPLRLGALKSNIGHAQAAAGVAGVIKMVQALRQGLLPRTLHVDRPTANVDWSAGEVELLTEAEPWERGERTRRAAVSAFGVSGTNAHLILEEAPAPAPRQAGTLPGPLPLLLSARSKPALAAQAERIGTRLIADPELAPADLAYSLATTRAAHRERAVALGADRADLLESLAALARGERSPATLSASTGSGRLAYLFTGQGSQRPGMGAELYAAYPAYAEAFGEVCDALEAELGAPLGEIVLSAEPEQALLLDHTAHAQPALFLTEVALARLLASFGLVPELLAGHSIGEIAAAHVAGVLSLADAAKLVAARGRLMGALPEGGAMVALEGSEAEVAAAIAGAEDELAIAAINAPSSIVLSGVAAAVGRVEEQWRERGMRTKRLAVSHAFHSPLMEPMLAEFEAVARSLTYAEPRIALVSNVTGALLDPALATDPAYWVAHVREPVRFADGLATLAREGAGVFVEIGPEAVLSALGPQCLPAGAEAAFIPTLREDRGEPEAIVSALAAAHANGAAVDWEAFFAPAAPRRVALPTYPFQRRRFWLQGSSAPSDAAALGQEAAEHPLLGAAVELADGGLLLTGRVSLASHPWLADHTIAGTVLLPGTAFLECALIAAERCGAAQVRELTLEAPLPLEAGESVSLRVSVGAEDEAGAREIAIHSRPARPAAAGEEWRRHASGYLADAEPAAAEPLPAWPPAGASELDLAGLYDALADLGFEYGPAFQGLTRAWKLGEEIYGEVALAPEQGEEAGRYRLHPALSDAAVHGVMAALTSGGEELLSLRLPFSWRGVSLQGGGAGAARVGLTLAGEEIGLRFADAEGKPLATVASLVTREVDADQLGAARRPANDLFGIAWRELGEPAGSDVGGSDAVVREPVLERGGDPARDAAAAARSTLTLVQEWLGDEERGDARLAILTAGAVATGAEASPDLAAAAIWGLVRSAQSEHPGRFQLIDSDGSEASRQALPAALSCGEPQLALREGALLVPRAEPIATAASGPEDAIAIDPERTVLLTGATGGLGAVFAEHLVEEHGARHLLLASRSGPAAAGAAELRSRLEALGAAVRIEACDVGDRAALAALLDSVDPAHPLGAVVHAAGSVRDSLVATMAPAQFAPVFAPKADAAWHLHELTAGADLSAFVLFSSVAGSLGGPGQGNYAAANCFLDALAQRRRAEGLPATAIAWGLWDRESGMTAGLGEADRARAARSGIEPIDDTRGADLFDRALAAPEPLALALPLDLGRLRGLAAAGTLPPLLGSLVRAPARRRSTAVGSLGAKLAELPASEHAKAVLEAVLAEVAAVLGHDSAAAIDPGRAFKDMGFDSLAAVELRNGLAASTGLALQPTLVFDYPTPEALAQHLLGQATASGGGADVAVRARASEEPVAIVGMACRYPGGVANPAQLWELLAAGRDGIGAFPDDRGWDLERLFDPDPDQPGTTYADEGGFLADAGGFDAEFFGIGPREAVAMDPQQRLLLESCWEALEDAGVDPQSLAGTATGVFAGVMYHDYGITGAIPAELEGYLSSGVAGSVASGRVAYTLGLEGPAMTVDTACSSSLVTLHLAAQALRSGECSMALAGGVTVLSTPGAFTEFARQRGLAPDGRCKSFAEAADGVGWAEGAGMLVLERLSDAERLGHPVLALVRGSAVNQDGASNGLTAPNGPSQQRVIRQALANARLEPRDVDMVEAHGTGTTLGDPIEAGALLATYGQDRGDKGPLYLGAIKSNLGHTQAAAGVAGVIKAVLAMREGTMPRTLHLDRPSSNVDWSAGQVELLAEPVEWKPNGEPRRAGVSSFGISGTNAHVILEEGPALAAVESAGEDGGESDENVVALAGPFPLLLSAKSKDALAVQAERIAARLREDEGLRALDLAFSLATSRASFGERAVAIGSERGQLIDALEAIAQGKPSKQALTATALTGRLAYLFTGQGSQRQGMSKTLYESYPAYADAFDRVCSTIDPELGESLKALVFSDSAEEAKRLDDTTYAQPAIFATEVALAELMASFGIKPDLLAGHSIGEIAAAHISGVFSLEDAAKLIVARGRLMGELPAGGAMVALEGTEAEVAEAIAGREEIAIAAVNAPTSTVVSGAEEAVAEIEAAWKQRERKTKRLAVSHAFHSPLMEPMLEEFEQVARSLTYNDPQTPIVSALTGELLSSEQATDPGYWVSHVREPVRFAAATETLASQGASVFIELGPDAVLSALGPQCLDAEAKAAFVPTLRDGTPEPEAIVSALASAHAHGAKVDWPAFFKGANAKRVALPTYPFQHQRYWIENVAAPSDASAIGLDPSDHPLLGAAVELADGGLLLTGRVSLASHPWLADHAVAGTVLLPGTALLECALLAAERCGAGQVEELTMEAPLTVSGSGSVALRVTISGPGEDGSREIAIDSRPGAVGEGEEPREWTRHAAGTLADRAPTAAEPIGAWPPAGAEQLDLADLYPSLADLGLEYGPAFQGLTRAWSAGEEIYAEVSLAPEQTDEAGRYLLHPALADAALHAAPLAATGDGGKAALRLPFAWRGVGIAAVTGSAEARVVLRRDGDDLSLRLADAEGTPLATVAALATREVSAEQLRGPGAVANDLFELGWQEHALGSTEDTASAESVETITRQPDFERSGDAAADALAATKATLALLQEFLADAENAESRLAILTDGAVAISEAETPDPVAASIWGLVRSAQSEHPGRFLLVDSDGSEEALAAALLSEEPQLALREGKAFCPRVQRVAPADPAAGNDGDDESAGETFALDPERTVLLTGATGGLGALFAEHLVREHGAKHLLLVSRSGPAAAGADELQSQLQDLGASVRIEACDVADRDALAALLASIDPEHPLGAVIHAAGTLEDALIETMTPEQVEAVFPAKADAALALHELTADATLSAFVLFSSAAGVLGGPGQGNYAAANSFLDALAEQRRSEGLPATSIAWGLWNRESAMSSGMGEADLARLARSGIVPIADAAGTDLFDRSLRTGAPTTIALPLDPARLRALAGAGALPPLFGGLVRVPARRQAGPAGSLAARLAELPAAEHAKAVLEAVLTEVAAVLGHDSAAAIVPDRAFKDMGFDSLAAVELRNGLAASTGLALQPTLVFDYPTPEKLAANLLETLAPAGGAGAAEPGERELREALASIPLAELRRAGLVDSLLQLARPEAAAAAETTDEESIDEMDVESLIRMSAEGVADEPPGGSE